MSWGIDRGCLGGDLGVLGGSLGCKGRCLGGCLWDIWGMSMNQNLKYECRTVRKLGLVVFFLP